MNFGFVIRKMESNAPYSWDSHFLFKEEKGSRASAPPQVETVKAHVDPPSMHSEVFVLCTLDKGSVH